MPDSTPAAPPTRDTAPARAVGRFLLPITSALVLVTAVTSVAAPGRWGWWPALAGAGLLGAAELLFARAVPPSRRDLLWAVLCSVGLGAMAAAATSAVLLPIVFAALAYWRLELGRALAASGSFFVAVAAGRLAATGPSETATSMLVFVAVGFGASALAAVWIARVLEESEVRARLIEDLAAAREQLAAAAHETGVLTERTRIADEIHDGLAQSMAGMLLLIRAARRDLRRGAHAEADASLSTLLDQSQAHLAEIRALVAALGPADATARNGDLPGSLRAMVERFGRELGIEARFEIHGEPCPLPDPAPLLLVRVLQECLANIRKHAHARQVQVLLRYDADPHHPDDGRGPHIRLVVRDDGVGFRPGAESRGFGLDALERRAAQLGGVLTVESSPGHGTTVVFNSQITTSPKGRAAHDEHRA